MKCKGTNFPKMNSRVIIFNKLMPGKASPYDFNHRLFPTGKCFTGLFFLLTMKPYGLKAFNSNFPVGN